MKVWATAKALWHLKAELINLLCTVQPRDDKLHAHTAHYIRAADAAPVS